MKPALKFALVVFSPLLVPLLIPALCLGSNCLLITLIYVADPRSFSASDAAAHCAWSLVPILLLAAILLEGMFCHWLYRRWRSGFLGWFCVWLAFTIFLFLTVWFGFSILTSVGASDYSAQKFFAWTAQVAFVLTLAAQIGVIPWLIVAARLLRMTDRTLLARGGSNDC